MSQEIEYGITNLGFKPKTIDVIEEDMKDILKQNFGTQVDLSQQSALWRIVQCSTPEKSYLWVGLEGNFYNCFVSTASGAGLRLLGNTLGVPFKEATKATVTLKIIKSTADEVTVPSGSLFQTSEGIIFKTNEELIISAGDQATIFGYVDATANEAGESGNVGIGTITTPTSTISGVDSSTNEEASTGGTDDEDEEEYRRRVRKIVRATYTPAVIRREALKVDGVKGVKVIELDTSYIIRVAPVSELTQEIIDEIISNVDNYNPITVEYTIVESINVIIDIDIEVVLNIGFGIPIATSEVSDRINEYISELGLDDDVLKAEIVKEIMSYDGIKNITDLTITATVDKEPFTYDGVTPTYEYPLTFETITDIVQITGTFGGNPHTFVKDTDYQLLTTPARVDWDIGGDKPDDATEFLVDYTIPENSNGDIEIVEDAIAKLGAVNLSEYSPP